MIAEKAENAISSVDLETNPMGGMAQLGASLSLAFSGVSVALA